MTKKLITMPTIANVASKIGWVPPQVADPQTSKTGYTGTPDRTRADVHQPSSNQGQAETRSAITTYFTSIGKSQMLYSGDRAWARITLTLETAGPVAVGTVAEITPVLSGKGQLLETGMPMTFTVAKSNRLYIASTSVNRVKMTVEAVPWLEQIAGILSSILGKR